MRFHIFVLAVAEPNLELINVGRDPDVNARHLVCKFKLLTDKPEKQIFPKHVCVTMFGVECPCASDNVSGVFPDGLYVFLEHVDD